MMGSHSNESESYFEIHLETAERGVSLLGFNYVELFQEIKRSMTEVTIAHINQLRVSQIKKCVNEEQRTKLLECIRMQEELKLRRILESCSAKRDKFFAVFKEFIDEHTEEYGSDAEWGEINAAANKEIANLKARLQSASSELRSITCEKCAIPNLEIAKKKLFELQDFNKNIERMLTKKCFSTSWAANYKNLCKNSNTKKT